MQLLNKSKESSIVTRKPSSNSPKKAIKLINIRIEFIQIGEVDTMNEKFHALVKTTSKWYENERIEEYDTAKHWNPKLYIENSFYDKFEENVSYRTIRSEHKTMIIETRISRGIFWERMELPDFPFDIQELSISIVTKHGPNVCRLKSDTNQISIINAQALNTFKDQQKFKVKFN